MRIGGGQQGHRKCSAQWLRFTDPPTCDWKVLAPTCSTPGNNGGTLVVDPACSSCVAEGSCEGCTVNCVPHHFPVTGSAGEKKCHWPDRPDCKEDEDVPNCIHRLTPPISPSQPGGGCKDVQDEHTCLNAKENDTPCCWRASGLRKDRDEPKCAARGSADIQEMPQCAVLKEEKWDEMPNCVRACTNIFNLASRTNPGSIVYDANKCNSCLKGQKHKDKGGECDCTVKCADGYERIGGGQQDGKLARRFCPVADEKLARRNPYMMEEPPLCRKNETAPLCSDINDPRLYPEHCNNCQAGESCSCKVHCAEGFHFDDSGPSQGEKKCLWVKNKALQHASCDGAKTAVDCLNRKHYALNSEKDNSPCCYRASGFMVGTDKESVCRNEGTDKISVLTPPDKCASPKVAQFEEMPTCIAKCRNVFRGMRYIRQDNLDACDNCLPNKYGQHDCFCKVQCAPGSKRLETGQEEGEKHCQSTSNELAPQFQEAPTCLPSCEEPGDDMGRLDVSKCQQPCFPGHPCSCEVRCKEGKEGKSFWRGGGPEGQILCKQVTDTTAEFIHLPDCNPVCEPPGDQFKTMDVSQCQNRCQAGDLSCPCHIRCIGRQAGGGAVGDKICRLIPGDANRAAYGKWVNADQRTWPQNGEEGDDNWDAMPNCMSPLLVRVVDATNQEPVPHVTVEVYDDQDRHRIPFKKNTTDKGLMVFSTAIVHLFFKIHKEGWNEVQKVIDRVSHCEDPTKCLIQFAVSKKLLSGDVHPDGCYFLAQPGKVSYQMRAILQWNQKPADLDLWVRKVDCAESARKRYGCFSEGDEEYSASSDTCERDKFSPYKDRGTASFEARSCRVRSCVVHGDPQVTNFRPSGDGKTKEPICPKDFPNQFPKWVYWGARYVDRLEKQIVTEGSDGWFGGGKRFVPQDAPGASAWTTNGVKNFMILDVDQRRGRGPETVTFFNAPPGRYQIAVDQFSRDGHSSSPNIMDGMPYVTIYLGGNEVAFVCEIDPNCPEVQAVWNVVNIEIREVGPNGDGKTRYSVRLIDQKEQMQRLHAINLPTDGAPMRVNRWVPWGVGGRMGVKYPKPEDYFKPSIADYNDAQLTQVCHGKCVRAEGTTEDYDQCLVRS